MLKKNTAAAVSTITAPAGSLVINALNDAPSQPLIPPITAANHSMRPNFSVQNRAAAAGMIKNAIIRINPTACNPITVIAVTNNIKTKSRNRTGHPVLAAYDSSKQSNVNSFRNATTAIVTTPHTVAINKKSPRTIDAVFPYMNASNPDAPGNPCTIRKIATPAPKNTLKTTPIATSSRNCVLCKITDIAPTPAKPETAAPANNHPSSLPPPNQTVPIANAMPTPGNVAWERTSPNNERFLKSKNPPIAPLPNPSRNVESTTSRVL